MRPLENSSDLTPAQCEQLEQRVYESLHYLQKLLKRIEQLRFPVSDKLRHDVEAAHAAVMRLRLTLHYPADTNRRKEQSGQQRKSLDDPYWQSKQKRKG